MRSFTGTLAALSRFDLRDGVDGDEFLVVLTAFVLLVVTLVLLARWRAARRLRFPGLAEVLAWERVALSRPVEAGASLGVDPSEVRVVRTEVSAPAPALAPTPPPKVVLHDDVQRALEELRAEVLGHVERVQWRILVGVVVTVLLGIVIGAAVGLSI